MAYAVARSMKKLTQLNLFPDSPVQSTAGMTAPDLGAPERHLLSIALDLGARTVPEWSDAEERLTSHLPSPLGRLVQSIRRRILEGEDPLGGMFCSIRSAPTRRGLGATYTPRNIVRSMVNWAEGHGPPERVVDAGLGSGRFLIEAGRRFPDASLVGVELDPVPAILVRANLAVFGFASRARVLLGDYRSVALDAIEGPTLFIGNPPYVRHHLIEPRWKDWLSREARRRGLSASQLAGLHVHFYLATLGIARPGDFGTFITAAEWLDVNYGRLLRDLFLGDLGGSRILIFEPTALPFADAAATAAITCFEVGSRPATVFLKRARTPDELQSGGGGHHVRRERLEAEQRWSQLTRPGRKGPRGYIQLGELCRVHRGQVTGANKVWIAGEHSAGLPPSVLCPSVTKARELFQAGKVLEDPAPLRRVIDLPVELDVFEGRERTEINRFLAKARGMGADQGYIARNRRAWWSVGLRAPAPILATYVARRPPAFVRNLAAARHINIAHGIYPQQPMQERILVSLIDYLSAATKLTDGRTYAGGLTKFEPGEMERLLIPGPEVLDQRGSPEWPGPGTVPLLGLQPQGADQLDREGAAKEEEALKHPLNHQRSPQRQGLLAVDLEHADRRPADGRAADQHRAIVAEMPILLVAAGVEQAGELSRDRIDTA